jgi:hypothetical protein
VSLRRARTRPLPPQSKQKGSGNQGPHRGQGEEKDISTGTQAPQYASSGGAAPFLPDGAGPPFQLPVVLPPFVPVDQGVVGFLYLEELRVLVPVGKVGVAPLGGGPVGLVYLFRARVFAHAQDLVLVLNHGAAPVQWVILA